MIKYFTVFTLAALASILGGTSVLQQQSNAFIEGEIGNSASRETPVVTSGDNVYMVWASDNNMPNNNSEILFRASTDRGVTFEENINLSNTTAADSFNPEIAATDGDEVIVTWWEKNQTSEEEPVFRASVDNGLTFGPIMYLSTNGTLAQEEVEEAEDN
jgi:hypothetical protein